MFCVKFNFGKLRHTTSCHQLIANHLIRVDHWQELKIERTVILANAVSLATSVVKL